jgi:hypothetical protein
MPRGQRVKAQQAVIPLLNGQIWKESRGGRLTIGGSCLSHRTPDGGGCAGIVLAVERLEVIAAGIQVLAVGQAPWAAHRLAAVVADPESGRLPAVDAQLDGAWCAPEAGASLSCADGSWVAAPQRSAPSVPISGQPSLVASLPRRIGQPPQGPPQRQRIGRTARYTAARAGAQAGAGNWDSRPRAPWRPPVLFAQVRDVANGRQGLG